jgi:hypothetical protein
MRLGLFVVVVVWEFNNLVGRFVVDNLSEAQWCAFGRGKEFGFSG